LVFFASTLQAEGHPFEPGTAHQQNQQLAVGRVIPASADSYDV